jgi:hypothetical protein
LHHLQRVKDSPVFAGKAIVAEPDDVDQLDIDAFAGASGVVGEAAKGRLS